MQPSLPGLSPPAPTNPAGQVARVVLDTPVFHLSTPFDYRIPPDMTGVVPGVRVRVRVAGRKMTGMVRAVLDSSSHPGKLSPLGELVSPLPLLTAETAALCEAVSGAYAGSFSDVLRLAIPARRANVEANLNPELSARILQPGTIPPPEPHLPAGFETRGWERYQGGGEFLASLAGGGRPRAVWSALPGVDRTEHVRTWMVELRHAVAACLASGRRCLAVVPTAREASELAAVLSHLGSVGVLHGELGPTARARVFLRILGGDFDIVVGTRSAAFAPVPHLGLVALWDPDDSSLSERRAPGPHALGVVTRRRGCALLLASYSQPVVFAQLLERGWARPISAHRKILRQQAPRVLADPAEHHGDGLRLPSAAFKMLREALETGPALIHIPRVGQANAVRCAGCGYRARCNACGGPLRLAAGKPSCQWCDRPHPFACPKCSGTQLRSLSAGSERTTQEFGRAFPGVPITLSSGRVGVAERVGSEPRLVIATPGAEPLAEGGYAAAVILDAALATARPELAASDVALARWMNALALVRGARDGGKAMILGGADPALLQACLRWDPATRSRADLQERAELHLPPAWKLARLEGEEAWIREAGRHLQEHLPPQAEIVGPTPSTLLARIPLAQAPLLRAALVLLQSERSARKLPALTIRIDPIDL